MDLLYDRIFWMDIVDPTGEEKRIRIFCDRNGSKIYIEQGINVIEVDVSAQGSLASFLVKKMSIELTEKCNKPKDVSKNI